MSLAEILGMVDGILVDEEGTRLCEHCTIAPADVDGSYCIDCKDIVCRWSAGELVVA